MVDFVLKNIRQSVMPDNQLAWGIQSKSIRDMGHGGGARLLEHMKIVF